MTRASLSNRRQGDVVTLVFGETEFSVAKGAYQDGRPAEVFIDCVCNVHTRRSAHTSMMASIVRDTAVLISLALQHGVPIETMRSGISREDRGEPATVIGAVLDEMCGTSGPVPGPNPWGPALVDSPPQEAADA